MNHAPPLASHQGGVYEAIIRLVRKALESLVSDRKLRKLTDEGLSGSQPFCYHVPPGDFLLPLCTIEFNKKCIY